MKVKQRLTKQIQTNLFKVNISRSQRDGSFYCPNCGVRISPDDCSEAVYSIFDVKVNSHNSLEAITLACKRCNTMICLTGFLEAPETHEITHTIHQEGISLPCYISHI